MTRPVGHSPLGLWSSTTSTTSPTWRLGRFNSHCFLSMRVGAYSRTHRFQKLSTMACVALQCRLEIVLPSSKTSGEWFEFADPRRKWLGVNGLKSLGSILTCVNGRPFINDSISHKIVRNISSLTDRFPKTTERARFVLWTSLSQTRPKCGALGEEKLHSMPRWDAKSEIFRWFQFSIPFLRQVWSAVRFVPLSLKQWAGLPLRATNLRNEFKKESTLRDSHSSKWTARVTMQA